MARRRYGDVVTHVIMCAIGSAGCSAMSDLTTSMKTFRCITVASYEMEGRRQSRSARSGQQSRRPNQERLIVGEVNSRSLCQRTMSRLVVGVWKEESRVCARAVRTISRFFGAPPSSFFSPFFLRRWFQPEPPHTRIAWQPPPRNCACATDAPPPPPSPRGPTRQRSGNPATTQG